MKTKTKIQKKRNEQTQNIDANGQTVEIDSGGSLINL